MATKKASTKTKKAAPSSAKAKAKDQNKCTDWKAWDDQTPYRPYTLHVTGKCKFPTHGYKVTLKPPSGTRSRDPETLLLEKVVKEPSGPVVQQPEEVEVDYKKRIGNIGTYRRVDIWHEKSIPVKHWKAK